MARSKLSNNVRKGIAEAVSKVNTTTAKATTAKATTTANTAIATNQTSVTVPGLADFTPDKIAGSLPKFEGSKYQVEDPLNPSSEIPQVSQQQFDKAEGIYQGGIRAVKLTGMAFDLTRERFTTQRKQVSAFDAGIKLATEVEKAKGDYIDYLNQGEANKQKTTALGVARHKTHTDSQKAVYDIQTMNEMLEQSKISAEMASAQTQEKLSGLQEFQKQLGN